MLAGIEEVFNTFWQRCGGKMPNDINYDLIQHRLSIIVVNSFKRAPLIHLPQLLLWALRYRKGNQFVQLLLKRTKQILGNVLLWVQRLLDT